MKGELHSTPSGSIAFAQGLSIQGTSQHSPGAWKKDNSTLPFLPGVNSCGTRATKNSQIPLFMHKYHHIRNSLSKMTFSVHSEAFTLMCVSQKKVGGPAMLHKHDCAGLCQLAS